MNDFKFSHVLVVATVILLVLSRSVLPAAEYGSSLGPVLGLLVERNDRVLEGTGQPIDLASYADRLAVYSGDEPIELRPEIEPGTEGSLNYSYQAGKTASADRLGVLIRAESVARIRTRGATVRTVAGDVITATVSLDQLKEIALLPGVSSVRASRRLELKLNRSVPAVGADTLHAENPVLRGSGVVVGIVDTGIDYDHRDFRVEKNYGDDIVEESSRIDYIWDQVGNDGNGGPGPPPASFSYGTEYTEAEIERDIAAGHGPFSGQVLQADFGGHGTHVSGIAAGDGSSNPDPDLYPTYVGMAPEASVIAVKTLMTTGDIIDGVDYVMDKASAQGKPAVVNLSLGTHYGPHDGSGLFCRALDNLSGSGKIVVVSAGNEGDSFIHGNDRVAPGSDSNMVFSVTEPPGGGGRPDVVGINTWYPGESEFTVTVTSPGGHSLTAPRGVQDSLVTPDGTIWVDNGSGGRNPENGDVQLEVELLGSDYVQEGSDVAAGQWLMKVSAPLATPGGRYDSWLYTYTGSIEPPIGNNELSVAIPAVAESVIAVGAEITKTSWMGADGSEHDYLTVGASDVGNIAPFSSWGPTRDGRLKPEITAPGYGVASTLSGSYAATLGGDYGVLVTEDGKHVMMAGTSMSAPHLAGQVALMLQENPNLTPEEVQGRLTNTADSDPYTSVGYDPESGSFDRSVGPGQNYTWGYGKLDSDGAGRTIGFTTVELDGLSVKLGPNPAPAGEEVYVYYQTPEGSSNPTFKVFNAAGRELYSTELSPDKDVYQWSLETDAGKPLANGIYLYVVRLGDQRTDVGKLLVERR